MPTTEELADLEGSVRWLLDRELIKELKARYFRAVDTQAWELFNDVFTADGTFTARDITTAGRPEIIKRISETMTGGYSVHHGHMPELRLEADGSARGIWSMEDYVQLGDGAIFRGYGHYEEHYVRTEGGWRIASCLLTRLRVDWLTAPPSGWT